MNEPDLEPSSETARQGDEGGKPLSVPHSADREEKPGLGRRSRCAYQFVDFPGRCFLVDGHQGAHRTVLDYTPEAKPGLANRTDDSSRD